MNVIDFERLRLHVPEIRYDLPAGGRRLVQRVDGYIATFVSGTPVRTRRIHRRDTWAIGAGRVVSLPPNPPQSGGRLLFPSPAKRGRVGRGSTLTTLP